MHWKESNVYFAISECHQGLPLYWLQTFNPSRSRPLRNSRPQLQLCNSSQSQPLLQLCNSRQSQPQLQLCNTSQSQPQLQCHCHKQSSPLCLVQQYHSNTCSSMRLDVVLMLQPERQRQPQGKAHAGRFSPLSAQSSHHDFPSN